jgi:hypothetical protein
MNIVKNFNLSKNTQGDTLMAILKLISIECIETEDFSGADTPYLRVKGIEVWTIQST